jgi:hypothetical protein
MAARNDFDFDKALKQALDAIDIGPHCSCADITMEVLRLSLPLRWRDARYATGAFGGGVAGSGGPCGAFVAGLVALAMAAGERDEPEGCISELVESAAQTYYDDWMEKFGTSSCAELSGYPSLRDHAVRDEFLATGGADRCTGNFIRFAVEKVLELTSAAPSAP